LKNLKGQNEYENMDLPPVNFNQINSIDIDGNIGGGLFGHNMYETNNPSEENFTDRNLSVKDRRSLDPIYGNAQVSKQVKKRKKLNSIVTQDNQMRVKGENRYGSIDDEVYASAHFS
jgi:hypothetical protein